MILVNNFILFLVIFIGLIWEANIELLELELMVILGLSLLLICCRLKHLPLIEHKIWFIFHIRVKWMSAIFMVIKGNQTVQI